MSDFFAIRRAKQYTNKQLEPIKYLRNPVAHGKINLPADFIAIDFNLYRGIDGNITHDMDLDALWRNNNIEEVIYTDIETGNNRTGDGSEGNPYRTPAKAFEVASASANSNIKIIVNADILLRLEMFADFDTFFEFTNKNIVITTKNNKKIPFLNGDSSGRYSHSLSDIPTGSLLSWTLHSGNVYSTSRSNTSFVSDTTFRDDYTGNIKKMYSASSVEECENIPGSYFIDGSTVYVHTYNDREPDENIVRVFQWSLPLKLFRLRNSTLFIENFEFFNYDGITIVGDSTSHYIFHNCDFGQTGIGNSLTHLNTRKIYMLNCTTHDSYLDGFNYHYTAQDRNNLVFEYNCIGYNNGNQPGGTGNNFTTAHEGISTIRVNCIGTQSQGVVCADVNGCYSLLYDCQMFNSKLDYSDKRCASYQFSTDVGVNNAKAILVNCKGRSGRKSIISDAGTTLLLEGWQEGEDMVETTTTF